MSGNESDQVVWGTYDVYGGSNNVTSGSPLEVLLPPNNLTNVPLGPPVTILGTLLADLKPFYVPVLSGVGLLGNTLASTVLLRSKQHKHAFVHYLAGTCISDTFFLAGLFIMWMSELGIDLYNSPGGCQFLSFLNSVSSFLSLWFMASYAVDLLIRNLWPLQSKYLCTSMRAKIVILSLVSVAIVVYTNLSLTVGVFYFNGLKRCTYHPMFLNNLKWLDLCDAIFNILLPYIAICVIIGLCLIKSGLDTKKHQSSPSAATIITNIDPAELPDPAPSHCILLIFFVLMRLANELFRLKHIIRTVYYINYRLISVDEYHWQQMAQNIFNINYAWKLLLFIVCLPSFRASLRDLIIELPAKIRESCRTQSARNIPIEEPSREPEMV